MSPSALAPQTMPGAGSWADLMDADNVVVEKLAALGATTFWRSQRVAYDMNTMANTLHIPLGYPKAVYTTIAQVGASGGA